MVSNYIIAKFQISGDVSLMAMIDNETFQEFLKAFTSNPFRPPENAKLRKELIDNMVNYSRDHMSLLTAALLLKRKFTIDELVQNYYSNVDAFGYDMF